MLSAAAFIASEAWVSTITDASTKQHPAPFPFELAYRIVRMFSFHGDTVLDPFCGTATTLLATAKAERNSIGVEIDPVFNRLFGRGEPQNRSVPFFGGGWDTGQGAVILSMVPLSPTANPIFALGNVTP